MSPIKFIAVFVLTVCSKLINFAFKVFPHFILVLASYHILQVVSFHLDWPLQPLQFVSLAGVLIFFGILFHVHTFIEVLIFYGTASHLDTSLPL
jgi:hypothetical protein